MEDKLFDSILLIGIGLVLWFLSFQLLHILPYRCSLPLTFEDALYDKMIGLIPLITFEIGLFFIGLGVVQLIINKEDNEVTKL